MKNAVDILIQGAREGKKVSLHGPLEPVICLKENTTGGQTAFFFFFWLHHGILVPQPGIKPAPTFCPPLQWKPEVLTHWAREVAKLLLSRHQSVMCKR